jgi:hypothetical protein
LDFHLIAEAKNPFAESGALEMTLANISVDHYPYHQHGKTGDLPLPSIAVFRFFETTLDQIQ